MRIRLQGDQPTSGDFVEHQGTWYKLGALHLNAKLGAHTRVTWHANDRNGGHRYLMLYSEYGYTCWSSRACRECTYLDVHSATCPTKGPR